MKLRARLLLVMIALAVPVVAGTAFYAREARRVAFVEAAFEATVERMERGGRERCEVGPRRFGPRPRARRRPRVYDDRLNPVTPTTPPLEEPLRSALESGDPTAAQWDRGRVQIAMRMPWEGRCAVVVVQRRVGPGLGGRGLLRAFLGGTLLAGLMALAALIGLGPVVRRIRKLTEDVRAQASSGYDEDVEVRGSDEVAELARTFNEAGATIRARLEELRDRDEALTQFLANTTHDVMIPLTVLQGHLSDMADASQREALSDPATVKAALEEAHYLGSLIRNLSAAARLDAGEPMLARYDLDLREIVERVVERHRPLARQRTVEIDFAVPERPVLVEADSTLVEQALSNLVSNAIRYNHPGGHVAVVLEATAEGFTVRVMDDGPGIPDEDLPRIAEPRFRGGDARQRRPTGMGLGLYIVRDVCDKHGWSLAFDSPPEGGLTAWIRAEGSSDDRGEPA